MPWTVKLKLLRIYRIAHNTPCLKVQIHDIHGNRMHCFKHMRRLRNATATQMCVTR